MIALTLDALPLAVQVTSYFRGILWSDAARDLKRAFDGGLSKGELYRFSFLQERDSDCV